MDARVNAGGAVAAAATPQTSQSLPPSSLPGGLSDYAFFLDIDGTLIRFATVPGRAYVDPWLLETLRVLHRAADGAVALVSGRTLESIDRLFSPLRFAAAGQHGAERCRPDGSIKRHAPPSSRIDAARRCVSGWAAGIDGLLVEDKGICVAVHYRQAPERQGEVREALERCRNRGGDAYDLQPGKMVFELRPAGIDKGTAIREFMLEAPFAGRMPLFLGDDATDEHGFAAAVTLGGHAIKVGDGATLADWRVADVAALRAWLAAILGRTTPDLGWSSGEAQP